VIGEKWISREFGSLYCSDETQLNKRPLEWAAIPVICLFVSLSLMI